MIAVTHIHGQKGGLSLWTNELEFIGIDKVIEHNGTGLCWDKKRDGLWVYDCKCKMLFFKKVDNLLHLDGSLNSSKEISDCAHAIAIMNDLLFVSDTCKNRVACLDIEKDELTAEWYPNTKKYDANHINSVTLMDNAERIFVSMSTFTMIDPDKWAKWRDSIGNSCIVDIAPWWNGTGLPFLVQGNYNHIHSCTLNKNVLWYTEAMDGVLYRSLFPIWKSPHRLFLRGLAFLDNNIFIGCSKHRDVVIDPNYSRIVKLDVNDYSIVKEVTMPEDFGEIFDIEVTP